MVDVWSRLGNVGLGRGVIQASSSRPPIAQFAHPQLLKSVLQLSPMVEPMPWLIFFASSPTQLDGLTATQLERFETRRSKPIGSNHQFFFPTWADQLCRSGGIRQARFVFLRCGSGFCCEQVSVVDWSTGTCMGFSIVMAPLVGGNPWHLRQFPHLREWAG